MGSIWRKKFKKLVDSDKTWYLKMCLCEVKMDGCESESKIIAIYCNTLYCVY